MRPLPSISRLTPPMRLALGALLMVLGGHLADRAWAAADCQPGTEVRVWAAPLRPQPGEPIELVAVATDGVMDGIQVRAPDGVVRPLPVVGYGGPPWSLHGRIDRPARGTYRVQALRGGSVAACAEVPVGAGSGQRSRAEWGLATEALYAAWIERLFDAPPEEPMSFRSLAPVLSDPTRNFLHGHLGAGEDRKLPAEPDCADLPYYLRTYFAWKLGLPVAYRACSRGTRASPPRCDAPVVETSLARPPLAVTEFRGLTRRLMDTVHSGSARTALADEATDYYPVPLTRESLWPGTVYADPYGHVLVLVQWVPQGVDRGGLVLAVDAQPDGTVSRKRFWEGTFLFAQTASAGAGFKAHRPLVRAGARLRPAPNASLDGRSGLPPFSTEQGQLSPEDFYARMERLINPRGLDVAAAYAATLEALMEQLETRLVSVDNGEAYARANPRASIPMPQGPAIFETTGPWEDYSTPSRDMRLLIALHVLEALPERIRRFPELYVLGGETPASAAARIEAFHAREVERRHITYTRSDGSPWRLSLAEIYARRSGLEVGYNPNDCVERRWGATPATADFATCRRQAPPEQRARMEEYRPWFHERRRPPR
ncbi:MAG: hypothetical protein MUC77_13300 [Chromatiaceae bacterium]|jgi:hypothetical protein|nr:hypothetical protein [Chromatiaceae bacterium]